MSGFLRLEGQAKEDFYQTKYDYYKHFNLVGVFVTALLFLVMQVPDSQLTDEFIWYTLGIRSLVIIPLTVLLLVYRKTSNYRIMSVVSLLTVYAMIWGNIWAGSYVIEKSHVTGGFLMMSFVLLLPALSAPPFYAMVAQLGQIGNIMLADQLYHFSNLDVILSFNILMIVILCVIDLIVTKFYYDYYITQKKLEFALFHDPLTEVSNRRQLHKIMGTSHELSFLSDDIAILIMDVDHFKQVNDRYGHDQGDRILQFVADCIKHCLRGPDLLIRWGGEEFLAILLDCQRDQASLVAERIRTAVEKSVNGVCKITISLGVAMYTGGDCFETIKKADQALYVAKQNGRNQVVCYEDLDRQDLDLDGLNGYIDA